MDEVRFDCPRGGFVVRLLGGAPEADIDAPADVGFGFAPCGVGAALRREVRNCGRAPVRFRWRSPHPFSVEPSEGELQPGERVMALFRFRPPSASVFEARAELEWAPVGASDGERRVPLSTALSGVGKRAFLALLAPTAECGDDGVENPAAAALSAAASPSVDFGRVLPGDSATRTVTLRNLSSVAAHVDVTVDRGEDEARDAVGGATTGTRDNDDDPHSASNALNEGPFRVHPRRQIVPPGGFAQVKLRFAPAGGGGQASQAATLRVSAAGGNSVSLVARGECGGPEVDLSEETVVFGSCKAGGSGASRAFFVRNRSTRGGRVACQVLLDPAGAAGAGTAFRPDVTRLELGPGQSRLVNVRFGPRSPGHYHRRCFVLVAGGAAPLVVDLVGTAYAPVRGGQRPDPLEGWHLSHAEGWELDQTGQGLPPRPRASVTFPEGAGPSSPGDKDEAGSVASSALPELDGGDPSPTPSERRAGGGGESGPSLYPSDAEDDADRAASPRPPSLALASPRRPPPGPAGPRGAGPAPAPRGPGADPWGALFREGRVTSDGLLSLEGGPSLDFGACSRLRAVGHRTVALVNRSAERVDARWTASASGGGSGADGRAPAFVVLPDAAEIPPGGRAEFQVAFRPPEDGAVYAGQIEVHATAKGALASSLAAAAAGAAASGGDGIGLGAVRHPGDLAGRPVPRPWCLTLHCTGHTVPSSRLEASPLVELGAAGAEGGGGGATTLRFPPAHAGATPPAAQVVVLRNRGSTPCLWTAAAGEDAVPVGSTATGTGPASSREGFAAWPPSGVVEPGGAQLIAVRLLPMRAREYRGRLSIRVNGGSLVLTAVLSGAGQRPALRLGRGGVLNLKPTCSGAVTTQRCPMRNPTGVTVAWELDLPPSGTLGDGTLTPKPRRGVVPPGETSFIDFEFRPRGRARERRWLVPARLGPPGGPHGGPLLPAGPGRRTEVALLRVVGAATEGGLEIPAGSPAPLRLGSVPVGGSASGHFAIRNGSAGLVQWAAAAWRVGPDGTETPEPTSGPASQLRLPDCRGTLAPGIETDVAVELAPRIRAALRFVVRIFDLGDAEALGAAGGRAASVPLQRRSAAAPNTASTLDVHALIAECRPAASIEVSGVGEHPMLQLVGASAVGGGAPPAPPALVWECTSAAKVNSDLGLRLSAADLAEADAVSDGRLPVADVLERLGKEGRGREVALPPGLPGAPPSCVRLVLRNTSGVPARWSLGLPHEDDPRADMWVEPHFPPDAATIAGHLFRCRPRTGALAPGEQCRVDVVYRHDGGPGERRLPCLLAVQGGRCARLDVVGRTLDPADPACLSFSPSGNVLQRLAAARLGDPPALRCAWVSNEGPAPARYRLVLPPDAATGLDADVVPEPSPLPDCPALRCVAGREGVVPARGRVATWWLFSPHKTGRHLAVVPVAVSSLNVDSYDGGFESGAPGTGHDLLLEVDCMPAMDATATAVAGDDEGLIPKPPMLSVADMTLPSPLLALHRPARPLLPVRLRCDGGGGGGGVEGRAGAPVEGGIDGLSGAGPSASSAGQPGPAGEVSLGAGLAPAPTPARAIARPARAVAEVHPTAPAEPDHPVLTLDEASGRQLGRPALPALPPAPGPGGDCPPRRPGAPAAALSHQVLRFAPLARGEKGDQAVVVRSTDPSRKVRFRWVLGSLAEPAAPPGWDGSAAVSPAEGVLPPGGCVLCVFTASAGGVLAEWEGEAVLEAWTDVPEGAATVRGRRGGGGSPALSGGSDDDGDDDSLDGAAATTRCRGRGGATISTLRGAALAAELRSRPGATGYVPRRGRGGAAAAASATLRGPVSDDDVAADLDGSDSDRADSDANWDPDVPGTAGDGIPPPPPSLSLLLSGRVHAGEPRAPDASAARRLAALAVDEAALAARGRGDPDRKGAVDVLSLVEPDPSRRRDLDDPALAALLGPLLESMAGAALGDPALWARALAPAPPGSAPARRREQERRRERKDPEGAARSRLIEIEAEAFAAFVLGGCVRSIVAEAASRGGAGLPPAVPGGAERAAAARAEAEADARGGGTGRRDSFGPEGRAGGATFKTFNPAGAVGGGGRA